MVGLYLRDGVRDCHHWPVSLLLPSPIQDKNIICEMCEFSVTTKIQPFLYRMECNSSEVYVESMDQIKGK